MKKLLFFPLVILFTLKMYSSQAQDTLKEGKATLTISFPDAGDKADVMKATMGAENIVYFKNGSSRTEMKTSMGNVITIVNEKKAESYSLMNMMGMKYAIKFSSAQRDSIRKSLNYKAPIVKLTKDTKKVHGYNCKRAIVTTEMLGKRQETSYWYTTEINAPMSSVSILNTEGNMAGIKGFPVETTIKMEGITVVMTLSSIDKTPVPDSMFELPADYPIKTMEEIRQGVMNTMNAKSNSKDTVATLSRTVNGKFPEIEISDVNGKPLKLSSLRGKYVLVDFWASWCGPCRQQSANLVKAYNNYKDKGFTIYSISLDENKSKWLRAIAKDKLSWENHVCDFKGWTSPACLQLDIKGIPANYLLDKEGNVVAAGLYDNEIEKILKEKIK